MKVDAAGPLEQSTEPPGLEMTRVALQEETLDAGQASKSEADDLKEEEESITKPKVEPKQAG